MCLHVMCLYVRENGSQMSLEDGSLDYINSGGKAATLS